MSQTLTEMPTREDIRELVECYVSHSYGFSNDLITRVEALADGLDALRKAAKPLADFARQCDAWDEKHGCKDGRAYWTFSICDTRALLNVIAALTSDPSR